MESQEKSREFAEKRIVNKSYRIVIALHLELCQTYRRKTKQL